MSSDGLDDLLRCLANRRRRLLIEGVGELSEPVRVEALVEYISARETDASPAVQPNEHRDRIEVALLHNHLPKLDSARVIDVAPDDRTVRRGDRFDYAVSLLGGF